MTSRLRPESRPVLFSGGQSGMGRFYFSSGLVRSVVAHSLPARFEILIVRARICMTVLFQCKLWLCRLFTLHCIKSGPPPSLSRCSIKGSQTRAQQVEWCRCTCLYFAIRSAPFRLWQSYGPARAHSGAPLYSIVRKTLCYAVQFYDFS